MDSIHLTKAQSVQIVRALRSREGVNAEVENQAYCFAHASREAGRKVYRLDRIVEINPDEYDVRQPYGVRLSPSGLARVVTLWRQQGGVVLKLHRHPTYMGSALDGFSNSDDNADQTLASLFGRDRTYLSALLVEDGRGGYRFRARNCSEKGLFAPVSVVELRLPLRLHPPQFSRASSNVFARTRQSFGEAIVNGLSCLHVGIIGCGGLGWRTACALADSGIGGLTLVDFDCVEEKNLPRLEGATTKSIGKHKVEELRRYLVKRYPDIDVEVQAADIVAALDQVGEPHHSMVGALGSCDILVLVTDNHPSRLAALQVAEQSGIPYVVSGMHPVGSENMFQDLSVHVPHLCRCAVCCGFVDPAEGAKRGAGYVRGVEFPNVGAWNMAAAGQVANAVRMLATPLGQEALERRNAWTIGLSEPSVLLVEPSSATCMYCS